MSGYFLFPNLMKSLNITIFDTETVNYFISIIKETIKTKEEQGIIRNDVIDLLNKVKKGELDHETNEKEHHADGFAMVEESEMGKTKSKHTFDEDLIVAQCFIFFFGGFETVSSVSVFMAYELMVNPDMQRRLQAEIDETHSQLDGGQVTYEKLQSMKYLDQFVCETMRKYPAAPILDRVCTKEYELKYDDKVLKFEKGDSFYVPVYNFHHDPKYFPNPEKFDPERFSDENKDKINKDAYAPFGIGPR
jgi:cytochrome P450 family 9